MRTRNTYESDADIKTLLSFRDAHALASLPGENRVQIFSHQGHRVSSVHLVDDYHASIANADVLDLNEDDVVDITYSHNRDTQYENQRSPTRVGNLRFRVAKRGSCVPTPSINTVSTSLKTFGVTVCVKVIASDVGAAASYVTSALLDRAIRVTNVDAYEPDQNSKQWYNMSPAARVRNEPDEDPRVLDTWVKVRERTRAPGWTPGKYYLEVYSSRGHIVRVKRCFPDDESTINFPRAWDLFKLDFDDYVEVQYNKCAGSTGNTMISMVKVSGLKFRVNELKEGETVEEAPHSPIPQRGPDRPTMVRSDAVDRLTPLHSPSPANQGLGHLFDTITRTIVVEVEVNGKSLTDLTLQVETKLHGMKIKNLNIKE